MARSTLQRTRFLKMYSPSTYDRSNSGKAEVKKEKSKKSRFRNKFFIANLVLDLVLVTVVVGAVTTQHIIWIQNPFGITLRDSVTVPGFPGENVILNWTIVNSSAGNVRAVINTSFNPSGNFTSWLLFGMAPSDSSNHFQIMKPGSNLVNIQVLIGNNMAPGNYTMSLTAQVG